MKITLRDGTVLHTKAHSSIITKGSLLVALISMRRDPVTKVMETYSNAVDGIFTIDPRSVHSIENT